METRNGLKEGGYDFWLVMLPWVLVLLGLIAVLSASAPRVAFTYGDPLYFFKRQLLFAVLGIFVFLFAMKLSLKYIKAFVLPLLGFCFLLMVLVLVPGIGVKVGEAQRWIKTPFFTFQPSELARFSLVAYLALSSLRRDKDTLGGFLRPFGVVGGMTLLILLEPDFSGALFTAGLCLLLMFCYGWKFSHIGMSLLALMSIATLMALSETYILKRFSEFWYFLRDPSRASYQLQQAFIALARGGIFGTGVGLGKQKLFFLPAPHTDFVLANVGEELGFLGITLIVGCFFLLFMRGMRVALKHSDPFGANLALGLSLTLVLQALLNMGVVLGLLPTTGLCLPFVSYGGTSLLVSLTAAGLLCNLSRGICRGKKWPQGY